MEQRELAVSARVLEVIRGFYLGRRSGTAVIVHAGGEQLLHFRSGELFLDPADPLARTGEAGQAGVAKLVQTIAGWIPTELRVSEPVAEEIHLVGPLPTALILMESAARGRSDEELTAQLGGPQARIVGRGGPPVLLRLPALEPEDAFLLSRLESPMALRDLLQQGMMERRAVLLRLARLRALDLLATAEEQVTEIEESLLSPTVLKRFLDRVGAELESRPLALAAHEHRARVARLFAESGAMTHYELLGVAADAAPDQVFRAYQELARLVHPGHAARLDLAGGDAVPRLMFERATEAYLTLSDTQRRARYDARMGVGALDVTPGDRGEERARMAERNFQIASGLVAAEEFHHAIELLRQAVVFDPQPSYYLLLARCLGRNPNWIGQAMDACRTGLKLAPQDASLHLHLGQLHERSEQAIAAAGEYATVLGIEPKHLEAQDGLLRIASHLGIRRDALLKRVRAELKPG